MRLRRSIYQDLIKSSRATAGTGNSGPPLAPRARLERPTYCLGGRGRPLGNYIPPIDTRKLSEPKFATFLVGEWVDACRDLQTLEREISALTDKELAWRPTLLAERYSTNLVDLRRPIAMWLENRGVSRELLDTYAEKSEAELARRKRRWQSDTPFKGKP